MPIDPNTGQEQSAQSLLDLMQPGAGQADPYGGKTLAQILQGGNPYGDTYVNGSPVNGPGDGSFENWRNQPATNESVSAGIARGGQYQPDFARQVQSSGAEGGFFSIPGIGPAGQGQGAIPWGYYPDPRKENPAPGLAGMSTNNWRLLPQNFQDPRWAMRAGHIIDRSMANNPTGYVRQHGSDVQGPTASLGGPGYGFPVSFGNSATRAYFWPGQLEPWQGEGGAGTY